ncbi:hypothetical protein M8998_07510 [Sphingobacterium sp. lm-10]|uniref:hypothetical protein n=1 Tax=Sphingobacterium sp. lm-10 TaxID=2944904 RepID=UPI0020215935|nr:hypothetical protein [Sphingobacterium sp. lm-10]MCL7987782.1 hypothetical protein [Sphingobacterium sp. lm-10]
MRDKAEKFLEHYLLHHKVAATLEPDDLMLLRKVLYNFIEAKKDFVAFSMLLSYCSHTLTSKQSFSKDLAKISIRALEMILDVEE